VFVYYWFGFLTQESMYMKESRNMSKHVFCVDFLSIFFWQITCYIDFWKQHCLNPIEMKTNKIKGSFTYPCFFHQLLTRFSSFTYPVLLFVEVLKTRKDIEDKKLKRDKS
jgi:hypothetical protein